MAICLLPLLGAAGGLAQQPAETLYDTESPERGKEIGGWLTQQIRLFRSYPHLDRAYRLLDAKDLVGAKGELDTFLKINPGDAEAQGMALLVRYEMSDYEAVQTLADQLLSQEPGLTVVRMYRAMAKRQLCQFDNAAADFDAIARDLNVSVEDRVFALSSLAETRLQQGWYGEALAVLELLTPSAPRFDTFYRKGFALSNLGRHREAYEAFLQALGGAKDATQIRSTLRQMGRSAASIGKIDEASDMVKATLGMQSNDPRLMRYNAELAYGAGHPAEALRLLQPTLAGKPSVEDRELASALAYEVGANDVAIEQSRQVLNQSSDSKMRKRALLTIGYAEARLGQYDTAAKTFLQAYDIDRDPGTVLAAAQALEDAGRDLDAVALLEPLATQTPTAEMLAKIGFLYAKLGQRDTATRNLSRALNRLPAGDSRHQVAMMVGYGFTRIGLPNEAAEAFRRARDGHDDPAAALAQALALDAADRPSDAVRILDAAVEDEPTIEMRIALGRLLSKIGNDKRAVNQLHAALVLMPEEDQGRYDLLMTLGYAELRIGRLGPAADAFRNAVVLRREPRALLAMSQVLEQAKDLRGAIAAAEEVALKTRDPSMFLRLGLLYGQTEDDRHAILHLERALIGPLSNSERLLAYRQIGYSSHRQGRYDNAKRAFEQAIQLSPRDAGLYTALAEAQLARGNAANALEASNRSLSFARTTAGLRIRAAADLKLGNNRDAVQSYQELLKQSDLTTRERADVLAGLGFACSRLGDQRSAIDAFQHALDAGGRDQVSLRLNLANLMVRVGEWGDAVKQYQLAYDLDPQSQTLIAMARGRSALGQTDAAVELLNRALNDERLTGEERKAAFDELAYIYARRNNYSQAAVAWRHSLDISYDSAIALRLARVQRMNGQFKAANSTLNEIPAFSLSPALQAERFDEIAFLKAQEGDLPTAIEAQEHAAELDPAAVRTYQLALYYRRKGDLQKAIATLGDVVRQSSDPRYIEELGYFLMAAGHKQEATEAFRRVAGADANNVQSRKELGYLALHQGNTEEASRWFRMSIDLLDAKLAQRSQ